MRDVLRREPEIVARLGRPFRWIGKRWLLLVPDRDLRSHARAIALIESHHFTAVEPARRDRTEVQVAVSDRLLELPGVAVGEKNPGHVGFHGVDATCRLRIARGIPKERDFRAKRAIVGLSSSRGAHDQVVLRARWQRPLWARCGWSD